MKVLVLDGHNRAALAVTRSLGRAGHEVVVGDRQKPALAHWSRYCSTAITYPDPIAESDAFVESLSAITRDLRIQVIVPVSDITTFLVTRHRDRFDRACAVPFADADVVERAADKVDMVRTAERLGVPVPRSVVIRDARDVPDTSLGFPVVVKPWRSRILTAGGWRSTSVSYADDREALMHDLSARAAYEYPVLLQERIVGPGAGVFALYVHGKPAALFGHRRVRERPPWGGVSVLAESVELCPVMRDHAIRLLDDLGWHGVAMVEFKRDQTDGLPKLMEINGRFWGSLQLAVDAGVDFPALLMEAVANGRLDPQRPYRVGVRTRWFWGDVDALMLTLFGRARWPGSAEARRAKAVWDFSKLVGRNLHYDNPKPYDPCPWLLETRDWFGGGTAGRNLNHEPEGGTTDLVRQKGQRSVNGCTVGVEHSLARIGLDTHAWNALAASSETNTVFQTHQWTRSWLSAYAGFCHPIVITIRENGSVTGVAPFVAFERRLSAPVLRFIGDGRADYCDILASGPKGPVLSAIFEALSSQRWSAIEFNNLPAHSSTPALVSAIAHEQGYFSFVEQKYACPALVIEGCEDEARAIANKSSLRRRTNYFERLGQITCRNLRGREEVECYLDLFFKQHIARWRPTHTPSLFEDWRNRTFYRILTSALANTGWLLFSIVELDGRPIAMHYGFDYDDRILWYKPSFDVTYAAHSPGLLMIRHLAQHAIMERKRELDFTLGDEPFKKRFTNRTRYTMSVRVFRHKGERQLALSKRRLNDVMKARTY